MERSCGEHDTGIHAPYLEAIQSVPGTTAQEKHRWIANLIKERQSVCGTLVEIVETANIPRALVPLLQIEAAKRLIKTNQNYQKGNYEAIAVALKSEDSVIVNRALRAKAFFDGSNKDITNVDYFFEHLFPYVSLCARTKIIKCLAHRLAPKQQSLAEEFFVAVDTVYGIKQALPLLVACSESFIYRKVVERNIVLPHKHLQTLYYRYPDLVARYIKLSKFTGDKYERNVRGVEIERYTDVIGRFAKKRIETFVELYELHEVPPSISLSKKCAEAFLRYGKEHLIRNPVSYVKILPLKLIDATLMKTILSKLFPTDPESFSTDSMLNYLSYYPREKRYGLLAKSYQDVYGASLLDDPKNVTMDLMKILPVDERTKQARRKIEASKRNESKDTPYQDSWRCCLPTEEVIPILKKEVTVTSSVNNRAELVCEMIYACYVNVEDLTLLEILKYIRDRHKNERKQFFTQVVDALRTIYELHELSDDHWAVLLDVMRMTIVKESIEYMEAHRLIQSAARHYLMNSLPIDNVIDMLLDLEMTWWTTCFNILTQYPEYERKCLEKIMDRVEHKYASDPTRWTKDNVSVTLQLLSGISSFNKQHVKRNSKLERMSITNYPWAFNAMVPVIESMDRKSYEYVEVKRLLFENETELYKRFWPEKPYADVRTGAALALLKREPKIILENWEKYYKLCETYDYDRNVQNFVRSARWYNDLPILFVKRSMEEPQKNRPNLRFLAILFHGETYAQLLEPFLPKERTIDHRKSNATHDYLDVRRVISSMHYSNPPVPLKYLRRLCEGDYLGAVTNTLYVLCRRMSLPKTILLARKLVESRVAVRKHGIRLMTLVAGHEELFDFLSTLWKNEKNVSIREILFAKSLELVRMEPNQASLSFVLRMTTTLGQDEVSNLSDLLTLTDTVPNECIYELIETLLKVIDRLALAGLPESKVKSFTDSLLLKIDAPICHLLPEEFNASLVRRFLFNTRQAWYFVIDSYLSTTPDKFDERMNVVADIIVDNVKSGWNVAHPERPAHYPVNYELRGLIDRLVYSDLHRATELLLDAFLRVFLSVLTPQAAPAMYLKLMLAKESLASKTPKEFGERTSRKLPEVIAAFSPVFVSVLAGVLNEFSRESSVFRGSNDQEVTLGLLEGLIEDRSLYGSYVAALVLPQTLSTDYQRRYLALLEKFRASEHAVVRTYLNYVNNKRE